MFILIKLRYWDLKITVQDRDLINFYFPKCSHDTKVAWNQNEVITDRRKFTDIRSEILRLLVSHIVDVYGTVSSPKLKSLEYVVNNILRPGYPFMFSDDDNSALSIPSLGSGYGRGGIKGNLNLYKCLWDSVYQKQCKLKKGMMLPSCDDDEEGNKGKRGRKPHKYGIDNDKYYATASDVERGEYDRKDDVHNYHH